MARVTLRLATLAAPVDEVARLTQIIDDAERVRAARFAGEVHRRRFIVRRGRLREMLGAAVGEPPGALRFSYNAYGKPELAGAPLHFSASHSRDTMALAISDVPVGCDIEAVDEGLDWRPIAARLFAPEEQEELAGLPPQEAAIGFFGCWARKEAFVKALGQGLSYPLDAFAVSCGPVARLTRGASFGGHGWAMAETDIPGFAGAVVARADPAELTIISAS